MCLLWNGNPWKVKTSPSSKHFEFIMNLSISRMFSEWGTCSLVSKNVLPWSGVAKRPDIKLLETNLSSNSIYPWILPPLPFRKSSLAWHPLSDVRPCNWLMSEPSWHIIILWPGARFDDMSLLTFPARVAFSTHTRLQDLSLFHVFHSEMTNNLIICMLRHWGWSPAKKVWKVTNPSVENRRRAFWCNGTRLDLNLAFHWISMLCPKLHLLINILKLLLANPSRGDLAEINYVKDENPRHFLNTRPWK